MSTLAWVLWESEISGKRESWTRSASGPSLCRRRITRGGRAATAAGSGAGTGLSAGSVGFGAGKSPTQAIRGGSAGAGTCAGADTAGVAGKGTGAIDVPRSGGASTIATGLGRDTCSAIVAAPSREPSHTLDPTTTKARAITEAKAARMRCRGTLQGSAEVTGLGPISMVDGSIDAGSGTYGNSIGSETDTGFGTERNPIGSNSGGAGGSNCGEGREAAGFRRGRGVGGGISSGDDSGSMTTRAGGAASLNGGGTSIRRAVGTSAEGETAASGMVIGAKHDEHANGCPALATEAEWWTRHRGHRKRMALIGASSGVWPTDLYFARSD